MQALRLTGWKQAPELQEVAEPEPRAGEVLVRIGGSGVCHSDVHLMQEIEEGMLPFRLPFTLGHENAGWVEALGAGVSGLERGQPVAVYGAWGCGRCRPCSQGLEMYCDHQAEMDGWGGGLGADGGMAPLLLVHNSRHLIPLENVTPRDAAPLTDAALTPYHAIKRALHDLIPGSTAVVIGIGGLGFYAIQLLESLSPATIIAVDRQPQALRRQRRRRHALCHGRPGGSRGDHASHERPRSRTRSGPRGGGRHAGPRDGRRTEARPPDARGCRRWNSRVRLLFAAQRSIDDDHRLGQSPSAVRTRRTCGGGSIRSKIQEFKTWGRFERLRRHRERRVPRACRHRSELIRSESASCNMGN